MKPILYVFDASCDEGKPPGEVEGDRQERIETQRSWREARRGRSEADYKICLS